MNNIRDIVTGLTMWGLFCVGFVVTASSSPQTQVPRDTKDKTPTVLFMCPHGAAKSVLASAYFQRFASQRGLKVHVISAGTEPDPEVAPAIANHLRKNGYKVPIAKPRRASADDLAVADVVVSIGCDLKNLPPPRGTLMKWDDVPALSENFTRADEMIRERVHQLLDELLRNHRH